MPGKVEPDGQDTPTLERCVPCRASTRDRSEVRFGRTSKALKCREDFRGLCSAAGWLVFSQEHGGTLKAMADSEVTVHRLEPSLLLPLTWLVHVLLIIQGDPPLQNLTGFRCFG